MDSVSFFLVLYQVPNTFDFADWIGRTKWKKIYVTAYELSALL